MAISQAELARRLGLSAAMVCKLKRRGMPVDSVIAAWTWRAATLDPALVKSMRRPDLVAPVPALDPVALAIEAGARALEALSPGNGREFVARVEELRATLRCLSRAQEDRVLLPVDVWDALCGLRGPWLDVINAKK